MPDYGETQHFGQPFIDYFDDDILLLCRRDDLVTKRHKDRQVGFRPLCDHKSASKFVMTKKDELFRRGSHRIPALRLSLRYNTIRDTSHIIIHPELASHFHLIKPPLARTIHKRFEYCIVLDTLAMYDSAAPETRRKNILALEQLRSTAEGLKEGDLGSSVLQEEFDDLEKALWKEVGDLARFVPAENADIPGGRQCFPAE